MSKSGHTKQCRKKVVKKAKSKLNIRDPFFVDENYFTGKINPDISIKHDQYLYGK